MKIRAIIFLLTTTFAASQAANAAAPYDFVKEYIREIGAMEAITDEANADMPASKPSSPEFLDDCIRNGERYHNELRLDIAELKTFHLAKPLNDVPSTLAQLDEQKIEMYKGMTKICSEFMSGPKPNVDYGALAAQMPKISADLEFSNNFLIKYSSMVFATLIDERPDSKGHLSYLTITKRERDSLVNQINLSFGAKIDKGDQDWETSSASVLRTYLTKRGYKFSDERK